MSGSVSVTVVARNEERYIGAALEAILAQTSPPDEIVVVDDGSTDATAQVVRGMSGSGPIELIRLDPGVGSVAARNVAIERAGGEWIAECDADDVWLPGKLERQLAAFAAWTGASPLVVLGSRARNISENGRDVGPLDIDMNSEAEFWQHLEGDAVIICPHSSVLFRKADFTAAGGYDEEYLGAEDAELWERMARIAGGVAVNLPEYLYGYRKKRGGLMQTQFWRQQVNFLRIIANRQRARQGEPPLGYDEFRRQLAAEPLRARARRQRSWAGRYLYRFGASNVVNGRRVVGLAQLGAASVLDFGHVRPGLARYSARR